MPDLDQLLDTLVSDVTAGTRPPGAPTAIKQARRRRAKVALAAAGVVAFIAVGGGLAVGTLGGSDQLSPIGEPTTPSSESPPVQESAEPPASIGAFGQELDAILEPVPGWAITDNPTFTDYDYAFNGPCSGNWMKGATGGGDGGIGRTSGAGLGAAGWPTATQASDAAARFVENLAFCTATEWRTRPIAQEPGAVLASSADAVAWIQQTRTDVWVLQVPTTDGPPPSGVQVEVAEWMVDYIAWQNGWTEP